MNSILFVVTLVCITLNSVFGKAFTVRTGGAGVYTYSVLAGVGTLLFFLVTSDGLVFQPGILLYACWFAASYIMASVFALKAVSVGSLSLTSLVTNCALILPTLYGLIFLGEKGSVLLYLGIIVLIAALILVNKPLDTVVFNGKWLLFASINFIGNGMCSISQKAQQIAFGGAGKNELMILALIIVIIFNGCMAWIYERKAVSGFVLSGWKLGLSGGAANGVVNLFVMILVGRLPASLVFPLISGGGIVLTHLISRFAYKERLSVIQNIGFFLGILSVILLNL